MKFKLPEGAASISAGGVEYHAAGGIVEIPEEHAADLAWHGCRPYQPPLPPPPASGRGRKAKG